MLLILAQILDPFWKLWSFRKWEKGIDINPDNETSYATKWKVALPEYVGNEYCAKHRWLSITKPEQQLSNNFIPSAMASRFGQTSVDPYDLSSDDEQYLMPINVAETAPGRRDRAACTLTATLLYLNSSPESPKNWGRVDPNLNNYYSDSIEISSILLIPDITDGWHQQEETHPKYANLSNVARDISSIIPHGVGVEARCSLVREVIGWRQ